MGVLVRRYLILMAMMNVSVVGSGEKRRYLQERFPQLSATSFANSRDASFEQHVLQQTQGKGEQTHSQKSF